MSLSERTEVQRSGKNVGVEEILPWNAVRLLGFAGDIVEETAWGTEFDLNWGTTTSILLSLRPQ